MRPLKFGVRHRILAACLLISAAAVGALAVWGIGFQRVLRARARESCERMAEIFRNLAHDRLVRFSADVAGLAQAIAHSELDGHGAPLDPRPRVDSWAVYDAAGRRRAGRQAARAEAALGALGIGTPEIAPRERARLAEALAGRPATLLVPEGDSVYALSYCALSLPGQPACALQVAGELAGPNFPLPADGSEALVILRPFITSADTPHLVTLGGKARLMVHRPLLCQGRQLGTIAAAVPYDDEARYERRVTAVVVGVAAGALLILALLSYLLTGIAMVPLARVRSFVHDLQHGREVELLRDIPADEAGTLLEAYQGAVRQCQEWADRLMDSSRTCRDLLCGAVEALVNAIEAKDGYTAGHSQGVARIACATGRELGWDERAIEQLRLGALLHDVGKIGISLAILDKPDVLTPEEQAIVREHPVTGARILSAIPDCEEVVRTVLYHHERCDGSGYPTGARGAAIPKAARIVAIADVYDALTSRRSYRPAYSPADALAILLEGQGTLFDPEILDAFLKTLGREGLPTPPRALPELAAPLGVGTVLAPQSPE